jgi:hypothetical protein
MPTGTDTVHVAEEQATVVLTEEYGPDWSPGPFERGTDGPRVILVGIDESTTASRAGAYAAAWSAPTSGRSPWSRKAVVG